MKYKGIITRGWVLMGCLCLIGSSALAEDYNTENVRQSIINQGAETPVYEESDIGNPINTQEEGYNHSSQQIPANEPANEKVKEDSLPAPYRASRSAAEEPGVFYIFGGGMMAKAYDAEFRPVDCANAWEPVACTETTSGGGLEKGSGWVAGAGARVTPKLRLDASFSKYTGFKYEGESSWEDDVFFERMQKISGGDVTSKVYMLNVHFDVFRNSAQKSLLQPFLTLGVGYVENEIEDIHFKSEVLYDVYYPGGETNSVAWKAGIGLTLDITQNIALDASVNYLDLGTIKTSKYVDTLGGYCELETNFSIFEGMGALRLAF